MTTTTARKTASKPPIRKPAAKSATKVTEAKAAPTATASKSDPKNLIEALISKQAVLIKVRANGTRRSLPYYAKGSDYRTTAEKAAAMKTDGKTVETIAEDLKVSLPTVRRFLTGLVLAHEVEAGKYDPAWKPGAKEVVVHTVAKVKA